MPELPEVETIVRQLDKVLSRQIITDIEVRREKALLGDPRQIIGKKIGEVSRKAKMVVITFVDVDLVMVIHLKMTGQLIYIENSRRVMGGHPTADWVNALPSPSTRVIFDFDNGSKLFFNDLRTFGWMKLFSKQNWNRMATKLPPDVTDKEFTLEYFVGVISKSTRAIKLTLLDQAKLGGIGNIYANDALYKSKIDPRRRTKDLEADEVRRLYESIKEVIVLGIKYGGASVDKFVDAAGVGGQYQEHFLVYDREDEKCKRDGATIIKTKLGGRGTYYCPTCQI